MCDKWITNLFVSGWLQRIILFASVLIAAVLTLLYGVRYGSNVTAYTSIEGTIRAHQDDPTTCDNGKYECHNGYIIVNYGYQGTGHQCQIFIENDYLLSLEITNLNAAFPINSSRTVYSKTPLINDTCIITLDYQIPLLIAMIIMWIVVLLLGIYECHEGEYYKHYYYQCQRSYQRFNKTSGIQKNINNNKSNNKFNSKIEIKLPPPK